jgi:hypothetical protein
MIHFKAPGIRTGIPVADRALSIENSLKGNTTEFNFDQYGEFADWAPSAWKTS